jgi:hypothetical protein
MSLGFGYVNKYSWGKKNMNEPDSRPGSSYLLNVYINKSSM